MNFKSFEQLIEQLNKFEPQLVEEDNKLVHPNGLEFHVSTKVLTPMGENFRFIQAILRVTFKGVYVSTWGCEDAETSYQLAWWYQQAKNNAFTRRHGNENELQKQGEALFNNL